MRELRGDQLVWGQSEHLLALIFDALNMGNWQRSGDKNAPRPAPLDRPGAPKRVVLSPEEAYRRLRAKQERQRKEVTDG